MEGETFWVAFGAIGTAVSAFATVVTVCIARKASSQWYIQEEFQAKKAFKKAIADYSHLLIQLPEFLSIQELAKFRQQTQKLEELITVCSDAWDVTEGAYKKNIIVSYYWFRIHRKTIEYLNGKIKAGCLVEACKQISNERLVTRDQRRKPRGCCFFK